MMLVRTEQEASYVQIMNSLFKYEDNNIEYYTESDISKRILTDPNQTVDVKEIVDQTFRSLRNPYREAYLILKGELLDLKGMADALSGREQVVKAQSNTESRKRSDQ
jgi:hypothetical protein